MMTDDEAVAVDAVPAAVDAVPAAVAVFEVETMVDSAAEYGSMIASEPDAVHTGMVVAVDALLVPVAAALCDIPADDEVGHSLN